MTNFSTPFFSTNISDFWKKWHISLTSWLMDYVFTPLSFILRKQKKTGLFLSILITFILVGFWHGANWTFILFGILQGLYFTPMIIRGTMNRASAVTEKKIINTLKQQSLMLFIFVLLSLTSVFFRSENVNQAVFFILNIFSLSFFKSPDLSHVFVVLPFLILFFIIEWLNKDKVHGLDFRNSPLFLRWTAYLFLGFVILLAYDTSPNDFIYLQF